jgi:hypothetical protein
MELGCNYFHDSSSLRVPVADVIVIECDLSNLMKITTPFKSSSSVDWLMKGITIDWPLRLAILCEFFLSFTSNSLSANMFLKIIN